MPIALTMKAAESESGLSRRKLYELIAEGKLQSRTVGRRRLIVYKSLVEVIMGEAPLKKQANDGKEGKAKR
jgi:excisionase family DNA binding protein